MHEYKDLSQRTRLAVMLVAAYAAIRFLVAGAAWLELRGGLPPDQAVMAVDMVGILFFLLLLACIVTIGMWTYRAVANAHALSDRMTV